MKASYWQYVLLNSCQLVFFKQDKINLVCRPRKGEDISLTEWSFRFISCQKWLLSKKTQLFVYSIQAVNVVVSFHQVRTLYDCKLVFVFLANLAGTFRCDMCGLSILRAWKYLLLYAQGSQFLSWECCTFFQCHFISACNFSSGERIMLGINYVNA